MDFYYMNLCHLNNKFHPDEKLDSQVSVPKNVSTISFLNSRKNSEFSYINF